MNNIYGKLATTAIEQAAKKTEKDIASPLNTSESPFKKMLDGVSAGQEMTELLGIGQNNIAGKFDAISAEGIQFNASDAKVGLESPKGIDKIVDMLSEVNKGQMQMDNVVNEILYSGKRFNNQELLAIQAYVFKYAQLTEMTVKLAEQGVSGLKTMVNTQIQ